jgi:hypothetical protein
MPISNFSIDIFSDAVRTLRAADIDKRPNPINKRVANKLVINSVAMLV